MLRTTFYAGVFLPLHKKLWMAQCACARATNSLYIMVMMKSCLIRELPLFVIPLFGKRIAWRRICVVSTHHQTQLVKVNLVQKLSPLLVYVKKELCATYNCYLCPIFIKTESEISLRRCFTHLYRQILSLRLNSYCFRSYKVRRNFILINKIR